METPHPLAEVLNAWTTILGVPTIGAEDAGRELWPITAEDRTGYYLKRLSPWRNLPIADEARVLRWLSQQGIEVAEFMITEYGALTAEHRGDSYILLPHLDNTTVPAAEIPRVEQAAGRAIAGLHQALAAYPWPANSYREQLSDALRGDLLLPDDIARAFARRRDTMAEMIGSLPVQLVHGDLTPGNVLLSGDGDVAGFIDFDHLPLAPRVWDIAKYLSRRIRVRRGNAADSTERLAHLAPLLRGYQDVSRLSPEELCALPGTIAAANIIEASYGQQISSGVLERRKLPDHDVVLAEAVEAARWHLVNDAAVEEAVRSVPPTLRSTAASSSAASRVS